MDPFKSFTELKPKTDHESKLKAKKKIAKIDRKEIKKTDTRCKNDKELGIDKPVTKHHGSCGGVDRNQLDRQRTIAKIIMTNHKILEYMEKEQEAELIREESFPILLSDDEFGTEEEEEATQLQPEE